MLVPDLYVLPRTAAAVRHVASSKMAAPLSHPLPVPALMANPMELDDDDGGGGGELLATRSRDGVPYAS